jgi:hypothetical protein
MSAALADATMETASTVSIIEALPPRADNDNEPACNTSPFARTADALIAGGYSPITIMPRDKAPAEWQGDLQTGRWTLQNGWNGYATRKPTSAQIERWKTWPDANVGIVLGTIVGGYQLIAVDFDTDDQDELDMLQSQLPPSRMAKRGARGYTSFYRAPVDTRTKRYMVAAPTADKPDAKRCVLEILTGNAPRQTVMPPSMHPTGQAYQWMTGEGVVPIHLLPVLSADHFEALEDTLEHIGWNGTVVDKPPRAANDDDEATIWRKTNDVALQRLDSWVGELGLPKLKRHGNGRWECVARWRPSGNNNPMANRKPNLSFHTTGIRDLGTDQGYSALDVIIEAFGCDLDTAFAWLRNRLGITSDDATIELPRQLEESQDGTLHDRATGEVVAAASLETADEHEFPDALTRPAGILGAMVDYIEQTADRPNRTLALGAAIVVLGTLLGRKDATPTKSGTHMYVIALAATAAGKQHPQNCGEALMKAATSERGDKLVGAPEYMSHTALIDDLANNPLLVCFIDEFGEILAKMNSPKAGVHEAGLKRVILSSWGMSFNLYRTPAWAGRPSKVIGSPALSIFGASTPTKFFKALQGDDRENGMLNRFLLLPTYTKAALVDPAYDFRDVPTSLVDALQAIYRARRSIYLVQPEIPDFHVAPWGEAAKEIYDAFTTECDSLGDFFGRCAEMAVRLATIVAVGRNADFPIVSVDDITWGIAVARWSAHRMATDAGMYVADSEVGRDRARIMAKLKKERGRCRQSEVMRDLGLMSEVLAKHVRDLRDIGLLTIGSVTPASGGRATQWLIAT